MSESAPPPPPPQYGAPTPPPYGGQPQGNNKKAIWSLVLGILSIPCCQLTGIPAIILANMAKKEIAAGNGKGSGLATAGLITGIIGTVLLLINIILVATGNYYFEFDTSTS